MIYNIGYPEFGPSRPIGGYTNIYTYEVIVGPASYAITLAEFKNYAKIDSTADDALINLIIPAISQYFERFTGRTLINTTYRTYRDGFHFLYTTLRRSKLQSIVQMQYLKAGVPTVVDPATYAIIRHNNYGRLYLVNGKSWPADSDLQPQSMWIDFLAGYGIDATYVPAEVKLGLLQHMLAVYQNRGDCSGGGCESALPSTAKSIYDRYRIIDLSPKEFAGGDE